MLAQITLPIYNTRLYVCMPPSPRNKLNVYILKLLTVYIYHTSQMQEGNLERFGCVHFGTGVGYQHIGHDELSVLDNSCSTHIFWLESTVYLYSNVSSMFSPNSSCVNAIF